MDVRRLRLLLELSRLGSMHEVAAAAGTTTSSVSQAIAALAREAGAPPVDPSAEPAGVLRVAGFASAIRRSLLPAMADLAVAHPGIEVRILELEPPEAFDLLARDDVDLALTYDYDLAPAAWRADHQVAPLW